MTACIICPGHLAISILLMIRDIQILYYIFPVSLRMIDLHPGLGRCCISSGREWNEDIQWM